MRYPASIVDRIRQHFRLSEVVGKRISLKRHGREYQACCPFHQEKTPSFTVNDEKGFYHCFGCGAHGDVLSFVMEYDRLHYREAIEYLAQEAGITLPKPDKAASQQHDREEKWLALMSTAQQWFATQLQSSIGYSARLYLENRGIDRKTIEEFGIGYAPQSRDTLKIAMQQKGFSEAQMVECGLLIKVEQQPTYDRFRGRIMFPIQRLDGKIIAFGGRLLEKNDQAPKYLNSPETALFKKNETLFNAHRVRKLAVDAPHLIVVEGYTDVISLHAFGIPYAVAPLGTAFGEAHLQQLWRYHANPILCFDGDKAGQKAMLRVADMALAEIRPDRLIRFCALPNGEDPDSFIRSSGVQAMETLLKQSFTISELLWRSFIGNRQFSSPEELASAEQGLMQTVSRIKDTGLRRRITTAFQNRLWHLARQQWQKEKTQIASKSPFGLLSMRLERELQYQEVAPLEQIFALVVRFPSLLNDAEVEHAFYEWDWKNTHYHECVAEVLNHLETLSICRYVMAEFMTREFPAADVYLQQQYNKSILPAQLYGQDEQEGRAEARLLFRKLKQKVEQITLKRELQHMVDQKLLPEEANFEHHTEAQNSQLLELIKLQQKAQMHLSSASEDSYI